MTAPATSRWDHETRLLVLLALAVSVFSFLYYLRRGEVLLYGDAVAHINIARRVFDSKTPGLLQLGTVWLPLLHLLMVPFLLSDARWVSGLGGSIPSMAAFVVGIIGIFRLMRGVLSSAGEASTGARAAAWAAALLCAANPNLIYMQATAMGESLYLALFIWAVVYLSEFVSGDTRALTKCGICLAAASLTRYDGWFLTCAMLLTVTTFTWFAVKREAQTHSENRKPRSSQLATRTALAKFILIGATGPTLWLGYNAAVYRNPLEFANGPYSAKAVEKKTGTINPANGNLYAGASYFLKAAELNVAETPWLGRVWLAMSLFGAAAVFAAARRAWPLLLLVIPLPFYALSLAYGRVPIFVPVWWPFSQYNVRYGLELLPAMAAACGVVVYAAIATAKNSPRFSPLLRRTAILLVAAIVVASYASVWRAAPICYREPATNMRASLALERQLAGWLKGLPPDSSLLMYLGEHPGAVEQSGVPLRRVINEGNHRVWMQPSDPQGLWEQALANPQKFADYVLAFEGDAVWQSVHDRHFPELVEIKVTGQPRAILYRAR
jgi:hypothetical protein